MRILKAAPALFFVLVFAATGASAQTYVDAPLVTSNVAASSGKYDILGIKLGMSSHEASNILKAHTPPLQFRPDTIKYEVLPQPLMYGVYAATLSALQNLRPPPSGDRIYLMFTMPPSQQTVSSVTRLVTFSKETAPTIDNLVAELTKKYGTPSYDSHPADLFTSGFRDIFWVDDPQGNRLQNLDRNGFVRSCMDLTTFNSKHLYDSNIGDIHVEPVMVKNRLEHGFDTENGSKTCGDHTIVHAHLYYTWVIGFRSSDLVGAFAVAIGSVPLDRGATESTHNFLVKATEAYAANRKKAAQKNKPVL